MRLNQASNEQKASKLSEGTMSSIYNKCYIKLSKNYIYHLSNYKYRLSHKYFIMLHYTLYTIYHCTLFPSLYQQERKLTWYHAIKHAHVDSIALQVR